MSLSPPALPAPFLASPAPAATHRHLVLPYAALLDDSCQHLLSTLELPQLERLLRSLRPAGATLGQPDQPIPPHERVVARAWALDAERPAWAALATQTVDTPCAWLTPCHWTAGADQVRMDDPASLQLELADAQALHALLQPWFAQDGLSLDIVTPLLWRIAGAPLADLRPASLDRVLLRDVSPWLPSAQTARTLHRLHSEVQMLLYTHAFNDRRAERGLQPINAFWLHGAGRLDADALAHSQQAAAQVQLQVVDGLRQAALRQDWPAWKQAWLAADAGPLAELAQHVAQGGPATLSLCGEHHARNWDSQPRGLVDKIKNVFSPQRFAGLHQAL
ncbi:phosphoglycerate mutase [Comamonas aquatica]|uniref:phosphoglycerate mutase n=1 Tax=Comamonas aquatica TaxID=225991 RepID=UPI0024487B3D|nr:phosphoglycerate mutase [Comamonas aquatica]MDH0901248.1 phosphoglycerate mutase [Comamonas aquatica]